MVILTHPNPNFVGYCPHGASASPPDAMLRCIWGVRLVFIYICMFWCSYYTLNRSYLVKSIYMMHTMLPSALMPRLKYPSSLHLNAHLNIFAFVQYAWGNVFLKVTILYIYYDPIAHLQHTRIWNSYLPLCFWGEHVSEGSHLVLTAVHLPWRDIYLCSTVVRGASWCLWVSTQNILFS